MPEFSVAFIGLGHIGLSWAARAAAHGYSVYLWDAFAGDSKVSEINEISSQIAGDQAKPVMFCTSFEDAVSSVQVVFECITEDLPAKRTLFQDFETFAPADAVIASSTSSFPSKSLFRAFKTPQRCLIAHPMSPPHLIPLVEIVPHQKTSGASLALVKDCITSMAQFPVTLGKEIEGFVVNRLQAVLLNEAMRLIALGVCDANEIDHVFKQGFSPRWNRVGPMETANNSDKEGFVGFANRMGKMMNWIERQHNNVKPWNEKTVGKVVEQLTGKAAS